MLSHVFASCDATLAKTPFAFELACDWMESKDDMRRRCGYALFYELSKKNIKGMDDAYLGPHRSHPRRDPRRGDVGQRGDERRADGDRQAEQKLNKAAIRAAKAIGPVDIDYGDDNSCEPLDVLKHLTSDYLKKKLEG